MAIQKILTEPNKILRQISLKVENVDKDAQKLMDDLLETLYAAPGIGLAAIQIGIPKRVIVIDLGRDEEKKNPMYFVNPEVIWKSENQSTYEEGCLSVPNQFAEINRSKICYIKYLDYDGNPQEIKAEGLLATCIQHEIDHLNGVLIIDLVSEMQRARVNKEVKKIKKDSLTKLKQHPITKGFVL